MPEVVEVCLTALWLNKKISNKTLKSINVLSGRYSRHTLKGITYFNTNTPFKIKKVNSKGKFLWFELINSEGKECYIMNRFGLEGEWGFIKQHHSGVEFIIDDVSLYFSDSRNFGTLEIASDKRILLKELHKLAPDLLKTSFTKQEFYNRIKSYVTKGTNLINKTRGDKEIIKVLMDQTIDGGVGCGLGNYLSVEILYDCKISPYKKMKELYEDKNLSYKLAESIKYIVKLSFLTATIGYLEHLDKGMVSFIKKMRNDVELDKTHVYNFHPDISLDKKDNFSFRVYRQKKDQFGNEVRGDKIITGRTTYWAPNVQN